MATATEVAMVSHPHPIASLMFGTAQFGQTYGLANRSGAPSDQTIRKIIELALEHGMASFDTAAAYGDSEARLGRALADMGVADRVEVVTKIPALPEAIFQESVAAVRAIEHHVQQSMQKLRMDCLPTLLFHEERVADRYWYVIESLRDRGWVRHAGVSCSNDPGFAADFAAMPGVKVLQLPINLLDRRHLSSGSCAAASRHGKAVHVRSILLQGLLLMPDEQIPQHLADAKPWLAKLRDMCDQAQMPLAEVALRWALSLPAVSRVIVGVETVEQAQSNLQIASNGPLPADLQDRLDQLEPDLPQRVVTPHLWPKT